MRCPNRTRCGCMRCPKPHADAYILLASDSAGTHEFYHRRVGEATRCEQSWRRNRSPLFLTYRAGSNASRPARAMPSLPPPPPPCCAQTCYRLCLRPRPRRADASSFARRRMLEPRRFVLTGFSDWTRVATREEQRFVGRHRCCDRRLTDAQELIQKAAEPHRAAFVRDMRARTLHPRPRRGPTMVCKDDVSFTVYDVSFTCTNRSRLSEYAVRTYSY